MTPVVVSSRPFSSEQTFTSVEKQNDLPALYQKYCKPELYKKFHLLKIDKVFHRGSGDFLYYQDDSGKEQAVLDMLGGYGTLVVGHNNPRLKQKWIDLINSEVPFCSQLSIPQEGTLLAKKLNDLIHKTMKQSVYVHLTNSGAETVEAAMKHAHLAFEKKLDVFYQRWEKTQKQLEELLGVDSDFQWTLTEEQVVILSDTVTKHQSPVLSQLFSLFLQNQSIESASDFFSLYFQLEKQVPSQWMALEGSFHGKTLGALALTQGVQHRAPYEKCFPLVHFLPHQQIESDNLDNVYRPIFERTCRHLFWPSMENGKLILKQESYSCAAALFLEPLQGEGGMMPLSPEVAQTITRLAAEYEISVVIDEIQSGMGRTGTFLYSEQLQIQGQYYLLSKGLGGGLAKIGALCIDQSFFLPEFSLLHTSTFAEDNLSAGIARETLYLMEDDDGPRRAHDIGIRLYNELVQLKNRYPHWIKDIRGRGLMIGIELQCPPEASVFFKGLFEQEWLGYLISGHLLNEHHLRLSVSLSAPHVFRLEPSWYLSESSILHFREAMESTFQLLQRQDTGALLYYLVNQQKNDCLSLGKSLQKTIMSESLKMNPPIRKVAFLVHLLNKEDLKKIDPTFSRYSLEQLDELMEKTQDLLHPILLQTSLIQNSEGETLSCDFYGLFVDTEIIQRKQKNRQSHQLVQSIQHLVDELEKRGDVDFLGLGGHTSILTNNGRSLKTHRLKITTGNALTVSMGWQALKQKADERHINLSECTLAIVGAKGNIGQMYAYLSLPYVKRLMLIKRPGLFSRQEESFLAQLHLHCFEEIKKGQSSGIYQVFKQTQTFQYFLQAEDFSLLSDEQKGSLLLTKSQAELKADHPILLSSDLSLLKTATLIVSSSSDPFPIITKDVLGDHRTIICDVALPEDVDPSLQQAKPLADVLKGGLVNLVHNTHFSLPGVSIEPGHSFACMAETFVLGMINYPAHFSYGLLTHEQVEQIGLWAYQCGFRLGGMKTISTL
jgi:acetylornithine/succinyldiaminopimelate/putrescine aminotransferase/predicted amino acid dehydrogenase